MPDKYYQEYGPIQRRRAAGTLHDENAPIEEIAAPLAPLAVEEPEPRVRTARARRPRRHWLRAIVFLLVLGAIALTLPYATTLFAGERALDGVSLAGQPLGGKSREEIRALLEQRYADFLRSPLTITFEKRSWSPTLAQLGVQLDVDALTADALAAGHRGGPLERTQELWSLWQAGGLDVAPHVSVDMARLQAYLSSLAPEVERAPRDAALSFAEGKVLPTPAQPGQQVLADATAIDVVQALQHLAPAQVVLRTRTLTPTLTDAMMEPAISEARALLKEPLVLRHEDQAWTWETERIASFLTIERRGTAMHTAIDPERLTSAVEKLAQVADSASAEPRVAFRSGKLRITEQGKIGWRITQADAAKAISATLQLASRDMTLPGEQLTPQITTKTLPTLGIVELVGEGQTSYAGSAKYRITNIKAGAQRMNGVLIPPESEFSFNTQLGDVDEAHGFVQGYAVIGNHTQLEWGGGVCQDSTTVFRAAFWAGLPITERHAHPFYISWYDDYSFPDSAGPGMDATIYTGVEDLKFVNDTGHWLLMEASTDDANQVLTVRLYGTKPQRSVSIRGPEVTNRVAPPSDPVYLSDSSLPSGTVKQSDTARAGMDIAVYRVITESGAEKPPELFFTRFKAWPDVYVRGTG